MTMTRPSRVVSGERTANGALGLLRAVFNWASGRRPPLFEGDNPTRGHELFHEVEIASCGPTNCARSSTPWRPSRTR